MGTVERKRDSFGQAGLSGSGVLGAEGVVGVSALDLPRMRWTSSMILIVRISRSA